VEKILSEFRHKVGEFEVIDWVDDEKIAETRNRLDVDAPVELHWTWEYGSEVEELRRLYEKGKAGQWDAQKDVDWSTPVTKDDWLLTPEASILAQICKLAGKDEATQKAAMFDETAYLLSQLLHGEQAALQLCGQLTNVCEKMDQKFYAASQTIDEARHIEVFAKFLQEKMGTLYPANPTVKVLLDILLQAEGVPKKTLGMQTLFEGMAVGVMGLMRQEAKNPLLGDMLHRVEGDEARHAAFGVLSMRRVMADADEATAHELEDWAFDILETLNAAQQTDMLRLLGPKYDIDPDIITQMTLAMPNFAELNSMIYMHTVVPNLKNLGLITDRTEPKWREVGMMIDSRGEELRISDFTLAAD